MIPVSPQDPAGMVFALAVAHALADFPLQGEYLARQKVRSSAENTGTWLVTLCAHSLIHAGGVWLVTGSKVLGGAEFVLHALIDIGKGSGRYGLVTDQFLHLACKVAFVAFLCWK